MGMPTCFRLNVGVLDRFMLTLKWPISQKSRCISLTGILSIPLLAQCGGQTELLAIEQSSGGTGASAGGSTGVPYNASTGGSTIVAVDAGYPCNISPSQYDISCKIDSDCALVPDGNPCSDACFCSTTGININSANKYGADFSTIYAKYNQRPGSICSCALENNVPCCEQGVCHATPNNCQIPIPT